MKRVLTALVLIPVVLLVIFRAPDELFVLVVGLFALLAAWEYLTVIKTHDEPFRITVLVIFTIFFTGLALARRYEGLAIGLSVFVPLLAPFLLLALSLRSDDFKLGLRGAALSIFAFPYIAIPLACLVFIRWDYRDVSWFFILLLFLIVWSGDIFAYYVGKAIGKHKLAPLVSPGKTWEGAIASVFASILIASLFARFAPEVQSLLSRLGILSPDSGSWTALGRVPIWIVGLIALLTNISAQFGDLVESMIKRSAGVKDSGTLIPGHGGVLDRIDALLFAAPVAAILFVTFRSYFFVHP